MIMTATGLWVDPLKLDPNQVTILDIGISLSRLCRYNGHLSRFYSVAEHCLIGSSIAESPIEKLAFLLHDAAEADIGDIVGPLKHRNLTIDGRSIEGIESACLDSICKGLRLDPIIRSTMYSDRVTQLDRDMCESEMAVMGSQPYANVLGVEFDESPDDFASEFIERFKELSVAWRTRP